MLTVGDTFPAFALTAVKGRPAGLNLDTAFTEINSATDAGKWKIVFFWPKDFTFVCPTEIVAFGKMAGDFADRDAVAYGVSIDSEFVHLNWRLHHEDLKALPIPMLADVKRELSPPPACWTRRRASPCARPLSSIRTASSASPP